MSYKNLYINGCSFTAGHNLKTNQQFPFKLNDLLGTDLYNFSKNGNSQDSISFTTIHHLTDFDPKDTLVIIGLTWAPRSGVLLNNRLFNITPADISNIKTKLSFTDKNTKGKFSLPFVNIKEPFDSLQEDQEKVNDVLKYYTRYLTELIKQDENIDSNFLHKHIYNILNLQNYLTSRKFNYLLIDFSCENAKVSKLNSLLDRSRIIPMHRTIHKEFTIDPATHHPSSDATTFLAEYIFNKISSYE